MKTKLIATMIAALGLSACEAYAAGHAGSPISQVQLKSGTTILGDADGMSLYTFDADATGQSTCYGGCAAKWPPLFASADDAPKGALSIINRDDGTMQWAYQGQPLYLWIGDGKVGQTSGDGVGGVWHLARP